MAVKLQTIKEIRNYLADELAEIYPQPEVKSIINIVLEFVLRKNASQLFSSPDDPVSQENLDKLLEISGQLKKGKPVQYVLGETLFYGYRIKVNPEVLIPRPETEELADLVIKENQGFEGQVLDIGTGSGCIAIALAGNLPRSNVTGIDNSPGALLTAAGNAQINNVNVRFMKFDITSGLIPATGAAGIIVSNPPYVMQSEKSLMHKNVLDFEPPDALFVPDTEPLRYYTAILDCAMVILIKGGRLYFEINESKGESMIDLLRSYNYTDVMVIKDINGRDRIIKGIKNE